MVKKPAVSTAAARRGGEGFYGEKTGKRDDSLFHGEILGNAEADRLLSERAVSRAIQSGMAEADARRIYG